MRPRATTHAGHGSVKHNFREFPEAAKGISDINRTFSSQNKFFFNGKWFNSDSEMQQYLAQNMSTFNKQKERYKNDSRYKDLSLSEKYELLFYEKIFDKMITNQHERNASRRQQCLNKNAIDMLVSKKTQPEETIFQIGDLKNCPSAVTSEGLWAIYKDYQKRHNERFGKHIKVIDSTLHVDEGSYHIHERKVFIGANSHNEAYPSKESALTLLGIERPDMHKAKSRFNNRKQTYSAECRKIWIEVCQEHGIDIETIPKEYPNKKGLATIEYKVAQEQKRLQAVKEQADNISFDFVSKKQLNDKLTNDIMGQKNDIQKNNLMLMSQQSTIETNSQILKQQSQKKLLLKNDIDDMTDQAVELNQRMDILHREYSNDYKSFDEAIYVLNRLKEEYPDYAKELIANFESQSHNLEFEDLVI